MLDRILTSPPLERAIVPACVLSLAFDVEGVLHHSTIVSINGESFRLKDYRKCRASGRSAQSQ